MPFEKLGRRSAELDSQPCRPQGNRRTRWWLRCVAGFMVHTVPSPLPMLRPDSLVVLRLLQNFYFGRCQDLPEEAFMLSSEAEAVHFVTHRWQTVGLRSENAAQLTR